MTKAKCAFLAAAMAVSACASQGPVDNPVFRTGTWFSYLNGDDIRAACTPGAPARYRFVYNADYEKQVRTYDVSPVQGGEGAVLEERVFASGLNLNDFRLTDPLAMARGQQAVVRLAPTDLAALDTALGNSGFDRPAPEGKTLVSNSFYWVVEACRGGRFHFNAYTPEDRGYGDLPFIAQLALLDRTGVAFNGPRSAADVKKVAPAYISETNAFFELKVGPNGLKL